MLADVTTAPGVGTGVGVAVGATVGVAVGAMVGVAVGATVGVAVGAMVGVAVGATVGVAVGAIVGVAVGVMVGVGVGGGVTITPTLVEPCALPDANVATHDPTDDAVTEKCPTPVASVIVLDGDTVATPLQPDMYEIGALGA